MPHDDTALPHPAPNPVPTSSCPCDVTVLPATLDDNGPPVLPLGYPPNVIAGPMTARDDEQLPDPPQAGDQNEGWFVDWLAHIAWRIFNSVTRQFHVL